jgi:CubicO group peptidase (beta-lactamase class C family)
MITSYRIAAKTHQCGRSARALAILLLGFSSHSASAQDTAAGALSHLRTRTIETRTDAVRIWQNGLPIFVYTASDAPERFALMSIVKPIVALAVLKLVEEAKLDSLDQPVYTLYPEWTQGRKRRITIRHILNHTSGLQNAANVQLELAHLPDRVQAALAAEVEEDPGTRWRYNNKAYGLLSGIIERASGERAEDYIARVLFAPLGITDARWTYDPSGRNLDVTGGLSLRPDELVRIGQLVLDEGLANGRRVIRSDLVREALQPAVPMGRSPHFVGLAWTIGRRTTGVTFGDSALRVLRAGTIDSEIKHRADQLLGAYRDWADFLDRVDKVFGNRNALNDAFSRYPGVRAAMGFERENGFSYVEHGGDGGQLLLIDPTTKVVAVRLVRDLFTRDVLQSPEFRGSDTSDPTINQELGKRYLAILSETGFFDFGELVLRLFRN